MAQTENAGKIRMNFNAGVIISRNFSNYPLKKTIDDVSVTEYSRVEGARAYRPGFIAGADILLRSQEKLKFLLGFSVSHTSAEYHSSYLSEGRTSRAGFTKLTRATENDYSLKFTSLNFHAGVRGKLKNNWFFTPSLILNSPLRITRVLNGFTETVYSNDSGAEERDMIIISNESSVLEQKPANLSLNLKVEYQFLIRSAPAQVFLFRNFGLLYALPWWGIGVTYAVIH